MKVAISITSCFVELSIYFYLIWTAGCVFQTAMGLQRCRARLVLVTCDLPARAMVLCMKQFNGRYGCCYCYHPGKTVGDDHLHRFWPYDYTAEPRNHASMKEDIKEALTSHMAVGVDIFLFLFLL